MEAKKKKIITGLTGPIAGGKGVVADYLKEKGFFYSSTSDRVREELRRKFGPEVLTSRTYKKIINQKALHALL